MVSGLFYRQNLLELFDCCSSGEDCCVMLGLWTGLCIPACGYLCGPCVIAGLYGQSQDNIAGNVDEYMLWRRKYATQDNICCYTGHFMLKTMHCEPCDVPCGVGVACCFFPCALRQMHRERIHRGADEISLDEVEHNPEHDHERQKVFADQAADAYRDARKESFGEQALKLRIVQGSYGMLLSEARSVFHPTTVAVYAWQTVAEVAQANEAEWVTKGDVSRWQTVDWLAGLTGCRDSKLCAVITDGDREGWVVDYVVEPTTTIGEIWTKAQHTREEAVKQYGDVVMPVVLCAEDGSEVATVLRAADFAGATIPEDLFGGSFMFSGVKLDHGGSWGSVWAASGMAPDCKVELKASVEDVDIVIDPTEDEKGEDLEKDDGEGEPGVGPENEQF